MKLSLGAKTIRKIIKIYNAKEMFKVNTLDELWKKVEHKIGRKPAKPSRLFLKSKIIRQEDEFGLDYLKNKKIKNAKNIIVYYNGGAWVFGFSVFHYQRLEELMKIYEADAIAVKYPLMPEYSSKDIRERFKTVYSKIEKLCEGKKMILMGDSAGGHSAMIQTIIAKQQKRRIPDKLVLLSPALYSDLPKSIYDEYEELDPMLSSQAMEVFQEAMLADDVKDISDPLISPGRADLSYFPPIEIYIGNHDILCAQSIYFYENNKDKANIDLHIYDSLFHVFMIFPIKERKYVFNDMKKRSLDFNKHESKITYFNGVK